MKRLHQLAIPVTTIVLFLAAVVVGGPRNVSSGEKALAQEGKPAKPGPSRYFPGTEKLGADEMRVISCGTGLPVLRRSQAAACFMVELGNGEEFLFDIGSGSASNIGCLEIPYDALDKVFVSHLHTDHVGDLATLWINGWVGGRHGALHVWGPSGLTAEMGTKHHVEKLKDAFKWEYTSRLGVIPSGGDGLEVHEFNYRQENEVVYQKNGVTIRSWPAVHCIDGAVSYALEWNGLKFVFGGDTFPNKWYVKYGKDADIAIHECFPTPPQLMEKERLSAQSALNVATKVHTVPPAFAMVMAAIGPRMAVAYHFFNDFDIRYPIHDAIRQTYKGPLTMATDLLVWNVTKQDVRVRQVVVNGASWPAEPPTPPDEPDPKAITPFSPYIESGRLDVVKELAPMIDPFKKENNLK
jgi:ribonuclease Z